MKFLAIIPILFIQEIVSLNATLLYAHKHHIGLLIFILFILTTVIDLVIGYYLGKWVKGRFTKGKIVVWIQKRVGQFHSYVGKKGRWVALLLLGNFSFPYINAFIAAWLDMPFWESFFWLFVGNMTWYGFMWLIVIGVSSIVHNIAIAFPIILLIVVVATILFRRWKFKRSVVL
jgi:membrane protein YqaA with SNARE-associated domain